MSDGVDSEYKKKQKVNNDRSTGSNEMGAQPLPYKSNSNQRVNNKAAEYSRSYRERHQEKVNQRRRDSRQRKKKQIQFNVKEIEQITHATLDSKPSTNLHTLRQQRYYEKHKEEINKRKRDSRLLHNTSRLIPATDAERSRKYRAKNRQKVNEHRRNNRLRQKNVQQTHTDFNLINIESIDQIRNLTPSDQQSLNSSNDNVIQEMAHSPTTALEPTNVQRFEKTLSWLLCIFHQIKKSQ